MTTTDGYHSPISQLLTTLGLTREDLQQRSDEMRQFLTAENSQSSRVGPRGRADSTSSHISSLSRSNSIFSTSAPSLSRASSISFRDASPPVTPVKLEATEAGLPQRQFDSMDIIIERQRQARKEKRQRRGKEKDSQRRASMSNGSPTPSSASSRNLIIDSLLQRRDDDQMDVQDQLETLARSSMEARSPPPLTPQQSRYYREHTVSQSKMVVPKVESPVQTPVLSQQFAPQQPKPFYPLPDTVSLTALQTLQASVSGPPVTPHIRRVQTLNELAERSPLPPSSPFLNSPQSSPARPIVNLVSSPGPMGPPPEEDSYGKLPYTLPSGPYSPNKPDLSYAALLGQAILSSSDHRLTLQEIYDWITIVYPFFKRGETTWMNSIRHVLSTTACFRKVTRDRALGRTQWAIWDEDLECFKSGGFRKQFCKDMNGGKTGSEAKTKRGRKQVEDSDGSAEPKPKKVKKDNNLKDSDRGHQRAIVPATTTFPPTRPAPPLQPYRGASVAKNLTSEVVFPPLPTESGFRLLHPSSSSNSRANTHVDADDGIRPSSPTPSVFESQCTDPSSSASTSSVPDLTPNLSSSSPPHSSSEMELEAPIEILDGPLCLAPSATVAGLDSEEEEGLQNMFSSGKTSTKLTPVQFWGDSPRTKELSRLGGKLNFTVPALNYYDDDSEDEGILFNAVTSKNKSMLAEPFDRLPPSPTNRRPVTKGRKSKVATSKARGSRPMRLSTPPPRDNLTTPPPNQTLEISPVRTPLSHKGLHMSPSASLAHYKSHLDPPPTLQFDQSSSGGAPSTPKRSLAFPLLDDSPFRTSLIGMSPFRTPGSSGLFDPHDPRALLDEEFRRIGPGGFGETSPASGLFGKERQLLYDSPSGLDSSPGKYKRWW